MAEIKTEPLSLDERIEAHLKKDGIRMAKELSSGFFGTTYDERRVYSFDDLQALNKEGFKVREDMGIWLFNALVN